MRTFNMGLAASIVLVLAATGRASAKTPVPSRPVPPLRVSVEGKDLDARGLLRLTATVEVHGRLAARPILRLDLPAGAVLVRGAETETLPDLKPGRTALRTWEVRGAKEGFRVTVDAVGRSAGAHAEARFPASEAISPAPAVPIEKVVPAKVRGVTVEHAVPLDEK